MLERAFRPDLPAAEVDRRLRESLRDLRTAEEHTVRWFAEVHRRHLYRELGFGSIHQYAALRLGFGKSKTSQFLRLAESLRALPHLEEAVNRGEIPWSKAREVAKVATPATETAWIQAARNTTSRSLEEQVRRTREEARVARSSGKAQTTLELVVPNGKGPDRNETPIPGPESVPVDLHLRLSPEEYARYEALVEGLRRTQERGTRETMVLGGLELLLAERQGKGAATAGPVTPADVPRGNRPRVTVVIQLCETCGKATAPTSRGDREIDPAELRAALCDGHVRRPDGAGGHTRTRATTPPRLRRAALDRDRHRCRAAGCGSARFLAVHHCTMRSRGGKDALENLVTLCAPCHRALHRSDSGGGR